MSDTSYPQEGNRSSVPLSGKVSLRSVEDAFARSNHLYSTRTADAFRATDRQSGAAVLLWILRHPLAVQSPAANRFVQRLDSIESTHGTHWGFRCYGIDSSGKAFLAMDDTAGVPLAEFRGSPEELSECFVSAVKKVALLHQQGIVLGDICDHSFLVSGNQEVSLVGLLGTFEIEASQTALLPPPQTLHYVSPEQRSGSGAELSSDVYALGVLAYRTLTGRFLFGDRPPMLGAEEQLRLVPAPSSIVSQAPFWADDIIGKCIEPSAGNRFRDAGELSIAIRRAVETGVRPGGGGRWSQKTLIVSSKTRELAERARTSDSGLEKQQRPRGVPVRVASARVSKTFVLGALIVFGVLLAGGVGTLWWQSHSSGMPKFSEDFPIDPQDAPPELRPSLTDFFDTGMSMERRKEALAKIALSTDPISHAVLVWVVKVSEDPELRATAETLVVERIKKQGFARTANFMENWFRTVDQATKDARGGNLYSSLLRACDFNMPLDARKSAIHKLYGEDPLVALQIAAALSLDEPDEDRFVPVLRELLRARTGRDDLDDKGVGTLILSDRTLSLFFAEDIKAVLPKFSAAELSWALGFLVESNSPVLLDIAKETLQRNIMPPFQALFLKVLVAQDRFAVSQPVKRALIQGARGEVTNDDLVALGRWYDYDSESVLLGLCAIAQDPEVQTAIFDTLANRNLETEPARTLVDWIRNNYWEYRGKLAKSVGILGHQDIAGVEQIEFALDTLIPFSQGSQSLIKTLLRAKQNKLVKIVLERVGKVASNQELVPLLQNEDKEIRKAAVLALEGRNDIGLLQDILRAYEAEKDDEVRALYQEKHWVTKDSR